VSSLFDSLETGKPFSHCCDCGCALVDASMFVVNKSYVGEECVFEFALCFDCREKMHGQLSEESRVAMFDFMHDNIDMDARKENLGTESETDAYLAECIACQKPRESASGYTLGALFTESELIKGPFPMLMCSTCEEALAETISDETRKMWDRFIADHFPGPPSEIKLPKGTKSIFI